MKRILITSMLVIFLLVGIVTATGILQEGKAWQSKSGIQSAATGKAVIGDFFRRAQPAAPVVQQAVPKVKMFNAQSCGEFAVENRALLQLIAKKLGITETEISIITSNAVKKIGASTGAAEDVADEVRWPSSRPKASIAPTSNKKVTSPRSVAFSNDGTMTFQQVRLEILIQRCMNGPSHPSYAFCRQGALQQLGITGNDRQGDDSGTDCVDFCDESYEVCSNDCGCPDLNCAVDESEPCTTECVGSYNNCLNVC